MRGRPGGLALLIALGVLTGCAAAPPATPTSDARAGTCTDKVTAEEMVGTSDASPALACTAPHTLETYALAEAPAAITALGPERPGPELLAAQSPQACPAASLRTFLGATALDSPRGVEVFVKFPTRREWAGGNRRVLCDAVLSAAPGMVPRATGTLKDALRYTDSARIRVCRIGGVGSEQVGCDRPHQAERAGTVKVRNAAAAKPACAAQARAYAGRALPRGFAASAVPTADGRAAECWIERGTGTSSGTLRAGLRKR